MNKGLVIAISVILGAVLGFLVGFIGVTGYFVATTTTGGGEGLPIAILFGAVAGEFLGIPIGAIIGGFLGYLYVKNHRIKQATEQESATD